jgi:protoporphyrinogen oxidase
MSEAVDVLVIGGGISGATAARFLRPQWVLLEREPVLGGLSTQYRSGAFWFDYGGHYFHFQGANPMQRHLSEKTPFRRYARRSRVHILERLVPFPIQSHLESLPASLRRRIEREMAHSQPPEDPSMAAALRAEFGPTLYQLFFLPFLTKYYARDPRELITGMTKGSIPPPARRSGSARQKKAAQGYNPEFFYPVGELRRFWEAYSQPLLPQVRLDEPVEAIDLADRRLKTSKRSYRFRFLINTMPLPHLLSMLSGFAFPSSLPRRLRYTSTQVTNLVLARRYRRFHWVYLPQRDVPYYRMGYYPGSGTCRIYLEQSIARNGAPQDIAQSGVTGLLRGLGVIHDAAEILHVSRRTIPIAYVQFDRFWARTVPGILRGLAEQGIFSIGRYGGWNYSSMAEDALTARNTALTINRQTA